MRMYVFIYILLVLLLSFLCAFLGNREIYPVVWSGKNRVSIFFSFIWLPHGQPHPITESRAS